MIRQNFGTSGSTSVDTTNGTVSVTTAWTRVTKTITIPSISGKTLGTGNCLEVFLYSFSDTIPVSGTIDIWGVQIEYGSLATPFQTASGGSPQAELAMCQRYYYRTTSSSAATFSTVGGASSTTNAYVQVRMPQTMRTTASTIDFSTLQIFNITTATQIAATNVTYSIGNENNIEIAVTVAAGLVLGNIVNVRGNGSGAYLGFSAEL
jgi:hypothetical protein